MTHTVGYAWSHGHSKHNDNNLHIVSKYISALLLLTLFSISCIYNSTSSHAQIVSLELDTSKSVLHLNGQLLGLREKNTLLAMLEDGAYLRLAWDFSIKRQRNYWFDANVADITFIRSVEPDLISQTWYLKDETSGISWHTYSITEAIKFLTLANHLPLLDKNLLSSESKEYYILQIELHLLEIEVGQGWFSRWWNEQKAAAATLEFTLP
ncbi:MAG: DUF4390 domain-containing protein [Mariprofundales bacterium]